MMAVVSQRVLADIAGVNKHTVKINVRLLFDMLIAEDVEKRGK